jgi:hypothetical protein|tara:strand:- start:160 stop:288 length:129 start_codon:yes stop_codon:yes gene_type:complete
MNVVSFVLGSKDTDCDEVNVGGEEKGKNKIDGGEVEVEKWEK